MKTGNKIRQKRMEKGLSQNYIALQIGVSEKTYRRIENGESPLDIERLKSIADVLQVEPLELIDSESSPVFNSYHQKGGNANIFVSFSEKEKELYENRIKHLEAEVIFLQELLKKLKNL